MSGDLAAEIAAHRLCSPCPVGQGHCVRCTDTWPCLVSRLAARRTALMAAARGTIEGLTVADVCHGPAFDSEDWGNDCSVCRWVRPLVRALAPAEDGEEAAYG